jgi:hypothetical protein
VIALTNYLSFVDMADHEPKGRERADASSDRRRQ